MCEEGRERVPPSWMSPGVRRRGSAWPRAQRQGPVLGPVSLSLVFAPRQPLWRCRDAVWWFGRAGETLERYSASSTTEQPGSLPARARKEGDPTTGPVSPCGR